MKKRTITAVLIAFLALTSGGPGAWGRPWSAAAASEAPGLDRTPPRLAYTHGQVSFWRPGAPDWAPAQVNTPLAPGDRLYAAPGGTLELQIGAHAFVRAGGGQGGAEIGLDGLEPDYLQLKMTSGTAALDIRALSLGSTVDVNTPDAVLTIERAGYYRIEAGADRTAFLAYRGGPATLTLEDGARWSVRQHEQVVISGGTETRVAFAATPELTEWDRWNHERTDSLLNVASARYVPPGPYGVGDLDRHGTWRAVPEYGSVWVPGGVPAGWAPYSTGRWIWDPYFEWTWVDDAPWGWAPYHYGRWVHVGGYWAWAPGPIVAYPAYAPALVAFLGPPTVTVSQPIAWVALGWGEPCVPWWGGTHFAGRPWWGGWGGPRVVNKVAIHNTTVVNVTNINVYRNAELGHAIVTVPAERFGRGPVAATRLAGVDGTRLRPVHGAIAIRPTPASLVPTDGPAVKPRAPERRGVVAVRPPADVSPRLRAAGLADTPTPVVAFPRTKLVTGPEHATPSEVGPDRRSPRAPGVDLPDRGRMPPLAPRLPGRPEPYTEPRAPEAQRDHPGRAEPPRGPRESPGAARPDRSEQRGSPTSLPVSPQQPVVSPSVTRPTIVPAPRPIGPSVSTPPPAPGPDVPQLRQPQRPPRGPLESPNVTRPAPAQRRPEIERPRAPVPVQAQPEAPVVSRSRPPAVQVPSEARRPPAVPVVERPGRPGNDRDRRGPATLVAPRAPASPEHGRSDQPSEPRRGERGDRKIERRSR